VAVNHPIIYRIGHPAGDYFAMVRWSEEYTFSGRMAVLAYWHRPPHAMTDAFTVAGFRTAVISEPHPAAGARERFPDEFGDEQAFLCFLFFVLEAVQRPRRGRSVRHEEDLVARVVVAGVVLLEVLLGLRHQVVLVLAGDPLAARAAEVSLHVVLHW
jgi:hypothetical protein